MVETGSQSTSILLPPRSLMEGWVFPIGLRNGRQIAAQGKPGVDAMMSVLPEAEAQRYREVFSACYEQIEDVLVNGGGVCARGELLKPVLTFELEHELQQELAIYSTVAYFREAYDVLKEEPLHPGNFIWLMGPGFINNVCYEKRDFNMPDWHTQSGITSGKHIQGRALQGVYLERNQEIFDLHPLVRALGKFVDDQVEEAGLSKFLNARAVAFQMFYAICDHHGLGQKTVDRSQARSWKCFDTFYRRRKYHEAQIQT